jgi:NarL family two-component system sensor histidine kinase YdfH
MPDELPAGLRQNLARMVAEGLTNITRHAHASRASIHLSYDDLYLELVIQDDGAGFDPLAAEGQPGHYGLLGIRERARLAGGVLEITSAPQQGTILRVRLPRKMEKQDE